MYTVYRAWVILPGYKGITIRHNFFGYFFGGYFFTDSDPMGLITFEKAPPFGRRFLGHFFQPPTMGSRIFVQP